jgi:hypothetical protein
VFTSIQQKVSGVYLGLVASRVVFDGGSVGGALATEAERAEAAAGTALGFSS